MLLAVMGHLKQLIKMIIEDYIKLKEYLKTQPSNLKRGVLFFDTIDKKRVDLTIFYEPSVDKIFISGDESEIYDLEELNLLDKL